MRTPRDWSAMNMRDEVRGGCDEVGIVLGGGRERRNRPMDGNEAGRSVLGPYGGGERATAPGLLSLLIFAGLLDQSRKQVDCSVKLRFSINRNGLGATAWAGVGRMAY
jgi:hypothetical protein